MIWISYFTGFFVVKNKENALTKRRQVTIQGKVHSNVSTNVCLSGKRNNYIYITNTWGRKTNITNTWGSKTNITNTCTEEGQSEVKLGRSRRGLKRG